MNDNDVSTETTYLENLPMHTKELAVQYVQELLYNDAKIEAYCHENALHNAYASYPERRRQAIFEDDQELTEETPQMQLYWSARTHILNGLLGEMISKSYNWEAKNDFMRKQ